MSRLDDFRRIFKRMKRRMPTHKFCPKCRSPDVRLSSKFDAWMLPEQYLCTNCGYQGTLVLEEFDEKKRAQVDEG